MSRRPTRYRLQIIIAITTAVAFGVVILLMTNLPRVDPLRPVPEESILPSMPMVE